VIELLDDIKIIPVKKPNGKIVLPANTLQQSLPVDRSINKQVAGTSKTDKRFAYFSKWVMPPQPEAYIKCRRYDFL